MARKKMTRAEELLWVIQKHAGYTSGEAKTIQELLSIEGIDTIRSHITATASIWRRLGTGPDGAGLIARLKVKQSYHYYKPNNRIDQMDFGVLVGTYHGWETPRGEPMVDETPVVVAGDTTVNHHVKIDITFRFIKE